jgi:hypothetical protein
VEAPAGGTSDAPLNLRGRVIESGRPGASEPIGGNEPIRAGGHSSFEPKASIEPGGGPKPAGGTLEPSPLEEPPAMEQPAPASTTDASAVEEAPSQPRAANAPAKEPVQSGKNVEPGGQRNAAEANEAQPAKEGSPRPRRRIVSAKKTPAAEPSPVEEPPSSAPREPQSAGADSGRSLGINEAQEPKTGTQFEKAELAADRPQRPPKGAKYFDYESGTRGSFRSFGNRIKAHFGRLVKGGNLAERPAINEKVGSINTEEFIRSKPSLRQRWQGWEQDYVKKMNAIRDADPAGHFDNPRFKKLSGFVEELRELGAGEIGEKRPDLVEVYPDQQRIEVTDLTLKFGDEFHRFKTELYVEYLRDMFPDFTVSGNEYKGPRLQDPFQ